MKLNFPLTISNQKEFQDLIRFSSICFQNIKEVVNGNLSFADNLKTEVIEVVFSGVETKTVQHNLGITPTGYIVVRRSGNVSIYDGGGEFTSTSISVASNGAVTVQLLLF